MYVFVKDPLSNRYVKEQVSDVRSDFLVFNESPPIAEAVDTRETLAVAAAEPIVAQPRSGFSALIPTWLASRLP